MISDLGIATLETLWMTFESLLFAYVFAIPLAFLNVETKPDGLMPNRIINKITDLFIAIGRAIPFTILMVLMLPVTRLIIGTGIGTEASILPLSVSAIPFCAKVIEQDLVKVDRWIIVASKVDNASKFKIMFKIKFLSILPDFIRGVGLSAITILCYTTMVGTIGGGGLGNYAIVYGFQRYNWTAVFLATVIIVVIVFAIQLVTQAVYRLLKY